MIGRPPPKATRPAAPSRPKGVVFTATEADVGRRLDQVLAAHVPDLSRRRARVLLDLGGVFVDGRRTKMAGKLVQQGQRIEAFPGGALDRATNAVGTEARARDDQALPPFTIVHEDDDLVVVDKPAGLVTAPTPESDRGNLQSLLARRPGEPPALVVHRLDRDTSGLLVFAKTDEANKALAELFRTHDLLREYLAAVEGALPAATARIDAPLSGRRAVTHVAIAARRAGATLVRARLETGRTHQVRLHLAGVGHPVFGDMRYGTPHPLRPRRMALHATRLAFRHPTTGADLSFESPWPADLAAWWDALPAAE